MDGSTRREQSLDRDIRQSRLAQDFDAVLAESRLQASARFAAIAKAHRLIDVQNLALAWMHRLLEETTCRKLRIGHLMLLLHFGNMPKETTLYNTARFAKEVMPRLRHLCGEWEDKWWPRDTLADIAEPAPLAAIV